MDLFDMLSEPEEKPVPKSSKEIADEIVGIGLKHSVTISPALAQELSSLFIDPPPWAPWAK
ncbi:Hypothetical protein KNT65_gp020 [Escherichia phage EcS1]|uniref:Molybdenum ABC transporter n=1 Tax=Escherichia phage EcS1 TaxID=2083276 RepID=A0A2Z5ZBW0_9CAUD|nr:Hypothetical protein KNT65_gp020 [Escherichia phage EcS1]BBC78068.1 Hypothetical protein [Escherichia phage EcS1]